MVMQVNIVECREEEDWKEKHVIKNNMMIAINGRLLPRSVPWTTFSG